MQGSVSGVREEKGSRESQVLREQGGYRRGGGLGVFAWFAHVQSRIQREGKTTKSASRIAATSAASSTAYFTHGWKEASDLQEEEKRIPPCTLTTRTYVEGASLGAGDGEGEGCGLRGRVEW